MDAILAALDALSEVKKAQPARAQAVPPPEPAARPAAPSRAPRQAERPAAPAPKPARHAAGALQGMFEDGNTLLRAVIAAEVLGPPASMKEHHFWNPPPNEPST